MFQLNIKKFPIFDKLLNKSYTIDLVNYIIDNNNENYIINKKIVICEKETIQETELFSINKIYNTDIISQLPYKYKIDSNVLVKIEILKNQQLIVRGLINLEKNDKQYLAKASLSEIMNIIQLREVYILKNTNSFDEEIKWFNLIK